MNLWTPSEIFSLTRVGYVLITNNVIMRQGPVEKPWFHPYLKLDSGRSSPCSQLSSGGSEQERVPVESLEHFEPIRSLTISLWNHTNHSCPVRQRPVGFPQILVHSYILRRLLYDVRNNSASFSCFFPKTSACKEKCLLLFLSSLDGTDFTVLHVRFQSSSVSSCHSQFYEMASSQGEGRSVPVVSADSFEAKPHLKSYLVVFVSQTRVRPPRAKLMPD
jgi:hypothetical protein